ncbi:MAG: hypothetical protein V3W41_07500 [Planctomycetota bacterium]
MWFGWRDEVSGRAKVRALRGDTGVQDDGDEVEILDFDANWGHGPYGGATDVKGDFWVLGTGGTLYRVKGDDFEVEAWIVPASAGGDMDPVLYGISISAQGDVWLAGFSDGAVWKFDIEEEVFDGSFATGGSRLRGLALDEDGSAWAAANQSCGLVHFDTVDETIVDGSIDLPGCSTPVGVSIDHEGFVWVVDQTANKAFKVDPDGYAVVAEVGGLDGPYTYSDMTGIGLRIVLPQ